MRRKTTAVLSDPARRILEAYARYRRLETPDWAANARWNSCWENAASLAEELGVTADDFMAAQFAVTKRLMPNMLHGAQARRRYQLCVDTMGSPERNTERRLRYEMGHVHSRLAIGFTLKEVLSGVGFGLTPLFRYCAAFAAGLYDIVSAEREGACLQLRADIYAERQYGAVSSFTDAVASLKGVECGRPVDQAPAEW